MIYLLFLIHFIWWIKNSIIFEVQTKTNDMIKVKPFGVVVEVKIDEETYYVIIVNNFERFKTFGNWDLDSEPFVVMDKDMKPLSDENVELFEKIGEIIQQMVIDEKEIFE